MKPDAKAGSLHNAYLQAVAAGSGGGATPPLIAWTRGICSPQSRRTIPAFLSRIPAFLRADGGVGGGGFPGSLRLQVCPNETRLPGEPPGFLAAVGALQHPLLVTVQRCKNVDEQYLYKEKYK